MQFSNPCAMFIVLSIVSANDMNGMKMYVILLGSGVQSSLFLNRKVLTAELASEFIALDDPSNLKRGFFLLKRKNKQ